MFDTLDPIRGSYWKASVNSFVGSAFIASVGLWAAIFITQIAWGVNPVETAFAAVIQPQTTLP